MSITQSSQRQKVATFPVVVQPDFVERQAKTSPLQAVAEFVWNAVDADSTLVEIELDRDEVALRRITIRDNGLGIPYQDAPNLFSNLGGSWKRLSARSPKEGRVLHGREGRGRFKAIVLGRTADWFVTYDDAGTLKSYTITILSDQLREVRISEEGPARQQKTGVELVISEPLHDFRSLQSDETAQELAEIFAPYLKNYKHVTISHQGLRLDPTSAIVANTQFSLTDIVEGDEVFPVRLDIVEWHRHTRRALYLCNEGGFPLHQVDARFHIGEHQFSAYLKSAFIERLHDNNLLQSAEMLPLLNDRIEEAKTKIKDHFRQRSADAVRSVVEDWKAENSYPFVEPAKTSLDTVERQVFDIVAVTASRYLPDFAAATQKNRAFQLRMLRQAIEKSPEDLQIILREVLDLPSRQQEELARLLKEASLSAIISAAKVVSDRLKFLISLEEIINDTDISKHLKERSQLHRILADNTWVFGEEFNLMVDDQGLTECLRKSAKTLDLDIVIDRPVKHPSKTVGIVDLMLSKVRRLHKPTDVEHLVVELKAPDVPIGRDQIQQIEEYAQAIAQDPRFDQKLTRWSFWAISKKVDENLLSFRQVQHSPEGVILKSGNVTVWVRSWAQLIAENKGRLQFFQERLEHSVDKGEALKYLQERYADLLADTRAGDAIDASTSAMEDEDAVIG
ncbi:MAG: ATP-binding protein [Methylobacterium mesophilicum]|nr:ATP-binding protein [Methylobacterium mesophilicum]